jgi:hypothetical protein
VLIRSSLQPQFIVCRSSDVYECISGSVISIIKQQSVATQFLKLRFPHYQIGGLKIQLLPKCCFHKKIVSRSIFVKTCLRVGLLRMWQVSISLLCKSVYRLVPTKWPCMSDIRNAAVLIMLLQLPRCNGKVYIGCYLFTCLLVYLFLYLCIYCLLNHSLSSSVSQYRRID